MGSARGSPMPGLPRRGRPDRSSRSPTSIETIASSRRAFPWLHDGAWETFAACPQTGLLGYRRFPTPLEMSDHRRDEECLIVVINRAPSAAGVAVPEGGETVDLLRGCRGSGRIENNSRLTLPPHGIAVLAPPALAARLPGAVKNEEAG
jgi:hypothetical protein